MTAISSRLVSVTWVRASDRSAIQSTTGVSSSRTIASSTWLAGAAKSTQSRLDPSRTGCTWTSLRPRPSPSHVTSTVADAAPSGGVTKFLEMSPAWKEGGSVSATESPSTALGRTTATGTRNKGGAPGAADATPVPPEVVMQLLPPQLLGVIVMLLSAAAGGLGRLEVVAELRALEE